MTPEEYKALVRERDRIDAEIERYQNESKCGMVQLTKRWVNKRQRYVESLRVNWNRDGSRFDTILTKDEGYDFVELCTELGNCLLGLAEKLEKKERITKARSGA